AQDREVVDPDRKDDQGDDREAGEAEPPETITSADQGKRGVRWFDEHEQRDPSEAEPQPDEGRDPHARVAPDHDALVAWQPNQELADRPRPERGAERPDRPWQD